MPDLDRMLNQEPYLVPADDAKVTWMAMIQAQRAMTDVLKSISDQQRSDRAQIGEVVKSLHSIDKRLAVIENTSIERDVRRLDDRVKVLEVRANEWAGANKFAEGMLKYGPFLVALIAAIVVILIVTGEIRV